MKRGVRGVLCLLGCIINWGLAAFWALVFVGFSLLSERIIAYGKLGIVINVIFLVLCIVIGIFVFKLDLERLLLKYEETGINQWERMLFLGVTFAFSAIPLFVIGSGALSIFLE